MALTHAGAVLTEVHRQEQVKVALETVDNMSAVWPVLDPAAVDSTMDEWLKIALAIIEKQARSSAELALEYLKLYRALETSAAAAAYTPIAVYALDSLAVKTSLSVTGPWKLKALSGEGVDLQRANDLANLTSSAAAVRHSLNGGRDTIFTNGRNDPGVVGYARATSGNPCAFCAMLASRGGVYYTEETASFQPHDGCACFPEPIMGGGGALPSGAEDYSNLWESSTQGLTGKSAIRAFRVAYESQVGG